MSSQSIKAPKGTRDLAGQEVELFARLERVARDVFALYQFREVRTPMFESVDLFSRSLGSTSDVVEKEMFTFTDRGERTFALRPEGTAGVVRHFIENNLSMQGSLHRLFYMGPMFRAERPQAGRYRQFWQIGSEYFGSPEASADADTVLMMADIMRRFGVRDFSVQVNSLGCKECRPKHREALLTYLKSKEADLSEESRRRMAINPLRVLDSKVDGPKLLDAPAMKDFLCGPCAEHHQIFLKLLAEANQPVVENSRLVRGLDYYTRSVFEFVSEHLGAQSALAAGGRYDELVHQLGGPATPGVGFALGMDRLVSVLQSVGVPKSYLSPAIHSQAVVIPMTSEAINLGFAIASELRSKGVSVAPIVSGKKMKSQLSQAAESGVDWAIFIGEDELKSNTVTVKNLSSREQSAMSREKIISELTKSAAN